MRFPLPSRSNSTEPLIVFLVFPCLFWIVFSPAWTTASFSDTSLVKPLWILFAVDRPFLTLGLLFVLSLPYLFAIALPVFMTMPVNKSLHLDPHASCLVSPVTVTPGFVSDKVSVSVNDGDSVTLHTGVKTNQQEDIQWYFSSTRIAEISGDLSFICTDVQCNKGTERFKDRLKLDHQTGSLTIMNITNINSGQYILEIINSKYSEKIFSVSVTGVSAAGLYEMKEGGSVTLGSGVIKHPDDVMTWYFNETEITGDQSELCTDVQCKERFRDRLELDHQTGSLTITDTRTTDSGLYKLQMIISDSSFSITRVKRFRVSVTDSGLSSGAVAGIIIVVLLEAAAAVTVGMFYCRRRSHKAVPQNEDDDNF